MFPLRPCSKAPSLGEPKNATFWEGVPVDQTYLMFRCLRDALVKLILRQPAQGCHRDYTYLTLFTTVTRPKANPQ